MFLDQLHKKYMYGQPSKWFPDFETTSYQMNMPLNLT